jgi:hypothetical protein
MIADHFEKIMPSLVTAGFLRMKLDLGNFLGAQVA